MGHGNHRHTNEDRRRWALASTLGFWGGVGVAIGASVNAAANGTTPWLIVVVPLALDTVLGTYLGLRQRRLARR